MKILYPLAKRFIAGDDFESAKPVIQKMIDEGYEVSIDYIGENSTTYTQCRKAYREYSQIIRELQDCNLDISIKPSQLGLNIHPFFLVPILCYISDQRLHYYFLSYSHQ